MRVIDTAIDDSDNDTIASRGQIPSIKGAALLQPIHARNRRVVRASAGRRHDEVGLEISETR